MIENLLKSMGFNKDEIAQQFQRGVSWIQGNFDAIHHANRVNAERLDRIEAAIIGIANSESPPTTFQLESPIVNPIEAEHD